LSVSSSIVDLLKSDENVGHVYIIKAKHGGKIKIGKSMSIQKRLNSIRVTNGPIEVIGIIESKIFGEIESQLHEKFEEFREWGEWFDIKNKNLLEDEIKKNGGNVINKDFKNSVNVLSYDFLLSNELGIPDDILDFINSLSIESGSKIYVDDDILKNKMENK